jgi:Fe-S cluster assembly ATP-binding protein
MILRLSRQRIILTMKVGISPAPRSQSSESRHRADHTTSFSMRQLQDSGLDVDALRTVANGVTRLAGPDMSVLVITHYLQILEYLKPDRVHILHQGRVVTSGGPELAREIEREGYEPIIGPVAAAAGASRTSLTGVVAEAQA